MSAEDEQAAAQARIAASQGQSSDQSADRSQSVNVDTDSAKTFISALQGMVQNVKVVEKSTEGLDETVPGGRYKVAGKWVNCDGERIEGPDDEA